MNRHGKKILSSDWVDIMLVDIFAASLISILLLVNSFIPYHWDTKGDFWEPKTFELAKISVKVVETINKDYNKHILTHQELSELYTCGKDWRMVQTNSNIVELDYNDAQLIMQVGRAEGGPGLDGQLWAIKCILNRMNNNKFPNTVYDVVHEDGQFEVVWTGKYKEVELNDNTHIALAMIESGWDETEGAVYFEASSNTDNSWHARMCRKGKLKFIKEVEGNKYYK